MCTKIMKNTVRCVLGCEITQYQVFSNLNKFMVSRSYFSTCIKTLNVGSANQ